MIRAYCRCNSGHYFVGEYCPIDGWSSPITKELVQATQRVTAAGQTLSVPALRQALQVSSDVFFYEMGAQLDGA